MGWVLWFRVICNISVFLFSGVVFIGDCYMFLASELWIMVEELGIRFFWILEFTDLCSNNPGAKLAGLGLRL